MASSYKTCQRERFSDQPVLADCTGFLVREDVLITAGHCLKTYKRCHNYKWVFDYVADSNTVRKSDVYTCKKVLGYKLESGLFSQALKDYAVIQLDRKVEGREPLKFRKEGEIAKNTPLVVIGHPLGLPSKIADNAKVKDSGAFFSSDDYFMANLDTFKGSSGSPVFNEVTGVVEGMLVVGAKDFVESGVECRHSKQLDDSNGKEKVLRIRQVEEIQNKDFLLKN